jgi:hypothetical protein
VTVGRRRSTVATAVAAAAAAAVLVVTLLAAPASANVWRFETLDGDGGANGRTTNDFEDFQASVVWNNQPHVFYFDAQAGDLRHAWWSGRAWFFETLDGNGNGPRGRIDGDVGGFISAINWNNQPHVFYYDFDNETLRHAWWDGRNWFFEALDGGQFGPNGRIGTAVGGFTAAVTWNNEPHVFYQELENSLLRHAWWDGRRWNFETLDGLGGGGGRVLGAVAIYISAAVWNGEPHVFHGYDDGVQLGLRHAWWDGRRWNHEHLDGAVSPLGGGRTKGEVGVDVATVVWNNQPHVFYGNETLQRLRHAWWDGRRWQYENLAADAGRHNAVVVWNNRPHVFTQSRNAPGFNKRVMRHTFWNGQGWPAEVLDGSLASPTNGRVFRPVGFAMNALVWNNQPHAFYYDYASDTDKYRLRHAWFG